MTPTRDFLKNAQLRALERERARGHLPRREFIHRAMLLGVAASTAYALAGCGASARESASFPVGPAQGPPRRGGILRIGQMIARMNDPATYSWVEMSNQTRPICECLTVLGADNVIRPWLLESWQPSFDLKSWTLHVRPGVRWHNGEELTAEHVAWNVRRWLDPMVASVNRGLSTFAALSPSGVEVLDAHTLALHLAQPVLSVAEDFAEYSTHIVHPSFRPPLSKNPLGTGPYTLAQLRVAERCILRRVTHTSDGKPFTYWGPEAFPDEIHFYSFEQDNQVAALASGSVDLIYELNVDQLELAQSIPGARIASVDSAQTICLRMQVDAKPFDDIRVRRAIVQAADNEAIGQLVFGRYASLAENYHVAPIHPEYFALPRAARDVAGARRLLKKAGYASGLDVTISVGNNDGPWHQACCEALRDQVKEAGIRLNVEVLPPTRYWEVWNKVPFGATSWSHRPLGTMALSQAYRSGAAWNETHFSDPAFDRALSEAEAVLDPAQRRLKMQRVEEILRDAAVMVQPLWRPVFGLSSEHVHGYQPHPTRQMHLGSVWLS